MPYKGVQCSLYLPGIILYCGANMVPYGNKNGGSGVRGYEIHDNFIRVWFNLRQLPYTYSVKGIGQSFFDEMKKLARSGEGLSTFISRFVHDKYDRAS